MQQETKDLIDDVKPDGVSYDHWFRNDPRLPGGGQ